MTDNIIKLYEIAGVPRIYSEFNNGKETVVENIFSPYRQLELIKFVSNFKVYETVKHKDRKWFMCASIGCDDYYESRGENFDQTLANLILQLWQDLTVNQKQEIKRILQ